MENVGKIKVIDIVDNNDGTSSITFEADDKFKEWFMKRENLKRWSHKRFNKFVLEALQYSLELEKEKLDGRNKS